jgi:hypothetical protein
MSRISASVSRTSSGPFSVYGIPASKRKKLLLLPADLRRYLSQLLLSLAELAASVSGGASCFCFYPNCLSMSGRATPAVS